MPSIPYFYWTADYVWLHNKYGIFAVYKSGKIYLQAANDQNKLILLQFVLGYGIAMYAHLNGRIAIHCGCVCKHDNGVLITGTSGSGKSTLIAELISDGAVMLADDMIVAGYGDCGFPTIYPAFPQQKLCRDAAIQKGYDLDKLIYIDPDKDKFAVNRQDIFSPEPHQLNFVFEIVRYDPDAEKFKKYDGKIFVKRLEGLDTVNVFTNQLFLGELFYQMGFPPEQFKICLDLANSCKVYRIYRPTGRNTLTEIKEIIYKLCREQNEYYIQALRAAAYKEPVDSNIIDNISLAELCRFANLNKIGVLCSSIINNWHLKSDTEKQSASLWKIGSAKIIFGEHKKLQLLKSILRKTNESNLPLIFFKGCVLADLYPDAAFRNSGDTDLYIEDRHYQEMVSILTETGYVQAHYLDTPTVHTFFYNENEKSVHKIELHTSLFEDMTGPCIDILNSLDMTNVDNCVKVNCCGLEFTTLNHTNHLIYQMFHLIKHICCHGISVRYLSDISLFIRSYESDIDFGQFWQTVDQLGYDLFCRHLFSICIIFFDADKSMLMNHSYIYNETTEELLNDLVHFGMRSNDSELSGQFFYFEQHIEKNGIVLSEVTFDGTTVPYAVVAEKWQNNLILQKRMKLLQNLQLL